MQNDLRDAEILITGGAGFIGSNLAEHLVRAGAKVTIFDLYLPPYGANAFNLRGIKKSIRHSKADIRNPKAVARAVSGKDFVFHLAGQTGRTISLTDPDLDYSINVLGTRYVLDAIRNFKNRAKLIFTSSRGVIGRPRYLPVDERHPAGPRDMYGTHKLAAEFYCAIHHQEYGTRYTVIRPNNVYGPRCQIRSNHYGTINLFIRYALEGKTLPLYGTGRQTRDYIYIDDLVSALVLSTDKKADGRIYFAGYGRETSLLDIVKIIQHIIPDTTYTLMPFPKLLQRMDFDRFYSDSSRLKKDLGWKTHVPLKKGIARTADFYRKYLKHYL